MEGDRSFICLRCGCEHPHQTCQELREKLLTLIEERLMHSLQVVQNPKNEIRYIFSTLELSFEELRRAIAEVYRQPSERDEADRN